MNRSGKGARAALLLAAAPGALLAGSAHAAEIAGLEPLAVSIKGYFQGDGRFVDDTEIEQTDTFFMRRARLNVEGAWGDALSFRLAGEFGNGADGELYDAYFDWHALPVGELRVGKFKVPLGLERLQSANKTLFAELSLVDNLIPNRDVGVAWRTTGRVEAALGVFNQATDRARVSSDEDDEKTFVARVFAKPFGDGALAGLGIGVGGSYGRADAVEAGATAQTSARATVFRYAPTALRDGEETRVSPQFYWFGGPLGMVGEYVVSTLELTDGVTSEDISNHAWQLAGSWVVTGQQNAWGGPRVSSGDGRGAIELVARVSELDLDDDLFPVFANPDGSVTKARAFEAGVNWYPNSALKLTLNLARTQFDGGGANGGDREDEDLLLARAQLTF